MTVFHDPRRSAFPQTLEKCYFDKVPKRRGFTSYYTGVCILNAWARMASVW